MREVVDDSGEAPQPFTDEELTALALSADRDAEVDDDAVSLVDLTGAGVGGLLPDWYMPSPMSGAALQGWRRRVGLLIIVSLVLISAYGLCSTYGPVAFG